MIWKVEKLPNSAEWLVATVIPFMTSVKNEDARTRKLKCSYVVINLVKSLYSTSRAAIVSGGLNQVCYRLDSVIDQLELHLSPTSLKKR